MVYGLTGLLSCLKHLLPRPKSRYEHGKRRRSLTTENRLNRRDPAPECWKSDVHDCGVRNLCYPQDKRFVP